MPALQRTPLPYSDSALEPVMSRETLNYHWGHLYKRYVDNYNAGESPEFNRAGAFLHDIYFTQFTEPGTGGAPGEMTQDLIRKHSKSLAGLRALVKDAAMALHGSGWVYLALDGTVKTIRNHAVREDIVILVDMWEHAYALDYEWKKEQYLDNIWRIMNWPHIEDRLGLM